MNDGEEPLLALGLSLMVGSLIYIRTDRSQKCI